MKYRYLGKSGLAVSTIGLGTNTFGRHDWGCDEQTSFNILDAFVEAGGNFIDTADKYGDQHGAAEQIIGTWLTKQNRDDFVLASKCFAPTSTDINSRGLSKKHIMRACEASLKRLDTDYLDLYQVHNPDPSTPLEETLDALNTLVSHGKVRYIGCSNYPAWLLTKASYIAERNGLKKFISGQYLYNLLKRDIEAEIIPSAIDSGIGILSWAPLSGGMLTGKYINADNPPLHTRMSDHSTVATVDRYEQWREKSDTVVRSVIDIAKINNVTPAVVALAWLLKEKQVSSVMVGARSPVQIKDNCIAGKWILSDEQWAILNEISKIKHPYPYDKYKAAALGWFDKIR